MTTEPKKPVAYDWITDPKVGLQLLAKLPTKLPPSQARMRKFWWFQFTQMQGWLGGDVLAIARAQHCCMQQNQRPPRWLDKAVFDFCVRKMSAEDKRAYEALTIHVTRWRAVQSVRGQLPQGANKYKKGEIRDKAVWKEAAKLLKGTGKAEAEPDTIKKSFALIKHAGGVWVTLQSYQGEVERRDRHRRQKKVK
jgi:hypothetical protein